MNGMKGQISAEMIILVVVILALVALVASNLTASAEQIGAGIQNKSAKIAEGLVSKCSLDVECPPGQRCIDGECQ